ncbi:MAG: hypothetical protein IPP16_14110 [Acidimicrobiaceae bacterium]|nr:hypothetical protein [Acidimicrobiaceae bacterium]
MGKSSALIAMTLRPGRNPIAACTAWYTLSVVLSCSTTSPGPAPISGASTSPTRCGMSSQ